MSEEKKWWNKDIQLFGSSFGDKQKVGFYETLYTLTNAGLELLKALEVCAQEQTKKVNKDMLNDLVNEVVNGKAFSMALQSRRQFSNYECLAVQIGEQTGKLSFVLERLANYYDKRVKQRRQIVSALTYPTVVLVFSVLAVLFMVGYVVPMFSGVFNRFGGELPTITRSVIGVSDFVKDNGLSMLIITIVIIATSNWLLRYKKIRGKAQYLLLKTPLLGSLVRDSYLARWYNAMFLMTSSEIPMIQALELSSRMITFSPIQDALIKAKTKVALGDLLTDVLRNHSVFNNRTISLLSIAEEINKFGPMFLKLSDDLERQIEHRSKQLSTVMEPLIILVLGGVVALILVAMYLPMFKIGHGM